MEIPLGLVLSPSCLRVPVYYDFTIKYPAWLPDHQEWGSGIAMVGHVTVKYPISLLGIDSLLQNHVSLFASGISDQPRDDPFFLITYY